MRNDGSSPAKPILEATDVTVRFGGVLALNAAHILVPELSIVGLVGPNGAGKSTLFSVLSGIQQPSSGRVWLDGQDVTVASAQARARAGLARTFQHPELFAGLTVAEHLRLAYRVHHARRRIWRDLLDGRAWIGRDQKEDEIVSDLLERLGIAEYAERDVRGLPLGLSRLVEIGRAFATDPRVVLLDEASSGLDHRERERLVKVLASVPERFGASLLIVEHDVDLVLGLSSEVYVVNFGSIIATGPPAVIRVNDEVRLAYLGGEIEDAVPRAFG